MANDKVDIDHPVLKIIDANTRGMENFGANYKLQALAYDRLSKEIRKLTAELRTHNTLEKASSAKPWGMLGDVGSATQLFVSKPWVSGPAAIVLYTGAKVVARWFQVDVSALP